MFKRTRKYVAGVFAAASLAVAVPATAQLTVQDGLVNVTVGDVTILEDVNVGVAAQVAAHICDVQVGPVQVLARSVDLSGRKETICRTEQGPVRIVQN